MLNVALMVYYLLKKYVIFKKEFDIKTKIFPGMTLNDNGIVIKCDQIEYNINNDTFFINSEIISAQCFQEYTDLYSTVDHSMHKYREKKKASQPMIDKFKNNQWKVII